MSLTTIVTSQVELPAVRPVTSFGSIPEERAKVFIVRSRDFTKDHIQWLLQSLSPGEQARAAGFRFSRDHNSYVVVHGMLRMIIANQFGLESTEVEFEYNEFGKPRLHPRYGKLYFSLSHSRDISLLAFSLRNEIGADIEFMDPSFDFKSIGEACFTPSEQKYISPGIHGDATRFYRLWTRKEALLKAIGTGITEHLDVEVFRDINLFHGQFSTFPGDQSGKFMLTTAPFETEYMITVATQEDPDSLLESKDQFSEPLFIFN
jgi:4'-phosphopantetheinyl transferase